MKQNKKTDIEKTGLSPNRILMAPALSIRAAQKI
jgi:hypothetical protein